MIDFNWIYVIKTTIPELIFRSKKLYLIFFFCIYKKNISPPVWTWKIAANILTIKISPMSTSIPLNSIFHMFDVNPLCVPRGPVWGVGQPPGSYWPPMWAPGPSVDACRGSQIQAVDAKARPVGLGLGSGLGASLNVCYGFSGWRWWKKGSGRHHLGPEGLFYI